MRKSNGVYEFSKIMFKADIKNSKFYITLTTITVAFIFNIINMSYNNIYSNKGLTYKKLVYDSPYNLSNAFYIELPIEVIQKQNLLIVILITILFAAICNMNYIRKKTKEIAFMLMSGSSISDITRYVIYLTGKCYFIAIVIGIPIGFFLIPVFNIIMNSILGKSDSLFTLSIEGLGISLVYVFMQYLTLIILNIAFIVRRNILDLINTENTITFIDTRQIKIPGIFFVILYVLSVLPSFFIGKYSGTENISYLLVYVGTFATYGMMRFFIPKVVNRMKKNKFMFKGCRNIYFSNFLYSLSNSVVYIMALVLVFNYFIFNIIEFGSFSGVKEMNIFCIVYCCIVISLSLVYKLLIDNNDKMYIYNQLKILGYEKEIICKIVKRESILIFSVALLLPIILISSALFNYIMSGVYSVILGGSIIFLIFISLLISWFVSSKINEKKVEEFLL